MEQLREQLVNCPMSWGRTTTVMCMNCKEFVSIIKEEDTLMVQCHPTGGALGCAVVFSEGGD